MFLVSTVNKFLAATDDGIVRAGRISRQIGPSVLQGINF
jgi:hypothetical protein